MEPPAEVSYGRRLTEIAAERPDDVDLILAARDGAEREVSWRELESRSNQVARELARIGVDAGDVVALALPTCLEHIFVTAAVWKLGATLLPLRYDLPDWELQRLVDLAQPKVLITDVHESTCPVLDRAALAATTAHSTEPLDDRVSESVNLIASSGSTGRPKLIVMAARGVVAGDHSMKLMTGSERPHALVCSPLYHVNGFNYAMPLLLDGGRTVVMEKFDAAQAVGLIERHRTTFTVMVPTMLRQRVVQLDGLDGRRLSSLKRVIYGGAKVPEWVVDRWIELVGPEAFVLVYGSSEKIGAVMMTGAEWASHRGSTGRPQDAELSIRDENGVPVPTGEVGEIYMRPLSERTMYRYIGVPTPEPTADGFHTIGDLGRLDDDGYLYVVDRRTDMIITGGANVFPAEIETVLSEHPAVADQVVVGVPDDEWGHRVHAIVQPVDPAHPPTAEELRAFCKSRVSAFKVPKTFEVVDAVPRSEAGKLNRNALGEQRRPVVAQPSV